uniref:Uncharacterized protein n=1 Tax=Arundo donax TaxID=35708 RepID=A0A0A9EK76_ARUDO
MFVGYHITYKVSECRLDRWLSIRRNTTTC